MYYSDVNDDDDCDDGDVDDDAGKQTEQYRTTVELLTKMSGLSARAAKLASARGDTQSVSYTHLTLPTMAVV